MKILSPCLSLGRLIWLFRWAIAVLSLGPLTVLGGEPTSTPRLRLETGRHGAVINRIAIDRAGRRLATASSDKSVRIWDLGSGQMERVLRPPQDVGNEGQLNAVTMSPDGEWVATGGWTKAGEDSHSIYLFRRTTGELVRRLTGMPNVILDLAWSPDGRFLAAGLSEKNGIRVFRAENFALVGEDREYGGAVGGQGEVSASVLLGGVSIDRQCAITICLK